MSRFQLVAFALPLLLAVAAERPLAQTVERPPSTSQRSAFCRALDRTLATLPRGLQAFPALRNDSERARDFASTERVSPIPGFEYFYVRPDDIGVTGSFWGPHGNDPATQMKIMEELRDGILNCFLTAQVRSTQGLNREDPRGFEVNLDRGRGSFEIRGYERGGVSLSVRTLKPGQWEAFEREKRAREQRYTSVGCQVGDDVCLTRKAIGR